MIIRGIRNSRGNSSGPFRLVILTFLALIFTACSGLEDIDVGEIEDVRLSRFAERSVEFVVLMPIDNPTSFRFRIINVDLDVYINNEYIGKISNVDNVLIPSRSHELYSFPLKVEFSSILRGALSMYNFFIDRQAEVIVKGKISVRSFPFTRRIVVEEKTSLKLN